MVIKSKNFLFFIILFFIVNSATAHESLDVEKFNVSKKMEKLIMSSPFKVFLNGENGKKFMAYLYAEDEKNKAVERYSYVSGILEKSIVKSGYYYIYLYNLNSHSFFPYRTAVFSNFEGSRVRMKMNSKGSGFFVLPSAKNKADVLLISQFGDSDGNFYEAYGFSQNQLYLQKYVFFGKEKNDSFYGKISKFKQPNGGLLAYTIDSHSINQFKLFLSNLPRKVQLIPLND